jgi:hypothetical protein
MRDKQIKSNWSKLEENNQTGRVPKRGVVQMVSRNREQSLRAVLGRVVMVEGGFSSNYKASRSNVSDY